MTLQFQTSKIYSMRSACNHDAVWTFEVLRRTAKTVWLKDLVSGETRQCRVTASLCGGYEMCLPLGRYSMAPVLTAEKEVAPEADPAPAATPADPRSDAIDRAENVVRLSDWRHLKAVNG